jgi:hypothetical protein
VQVCLNAWAVQVPTAGREASRCHLEAIEKVCGVVRPEIRGIKRGEKEGGKGKRHTSKRRARQGERRGDDAYDESRGRCGHIL